LFLSPVVQAGWEKEACIEDFEKLADLGQGAFGLVWKMVHKKSGAIYAIKQMDKKRLKLSGMIEQVKTEIKIMYSLYHDNIIKLFNHFEDDNKVYLVIEFAKGGQLYDKLRKTAFKGFTEKEAASYVKDLVSSLEYLHGKLIIHRDIKPENLLIDGKGHLKLADFGWSNYFQPQMARDTFCGTLDYLAPEMLTNRHQHDHMVDIWAVGVLIYELLSGKAPFSSSIASSNMKEIEKLTQQNISNITLEYPKAFPSLAKDLVSKILKKNPRTRLNLFEIKNHPWIKCNTFMPKKELDAEALIATTVFGTNMAAQKPIAKPELKNVPTAFTEEEIVQFARPDSMLDKTKPEIKLPTMGDLIDQRVADFKAHMEKLITPTANDKPLAKSALIPDKDKENSLVLNSPTTTAHSESPNSNLESALKKKTADYEGLKEEMAQLKIDMAQLKNENNQLKNENNELNNENKQLKDLKAENINLRDMVNELQKQAEQSEINKKEYQKEKEELENKVKKLKESMLQTISENQKLKLSPRPIEQPTLSPREKENYETKIKDLQAQISGTPENEKAMKKMQTTIEDLQSAVDNQNAQIKEYEKLLRNMFTSDTRGVEREKKILLEDLNNLQLLSSMKQERVNQLEFKIKLLSIQNK